MADPITTGGANDPILRSLIGATIGQESSGNYGAIGAKTKHGRALGKYQILPSNIPAWSKDVLGQEVSPSEFLKNPNLQDQIAQGKISQFYNDNLSISASPIEAAQRTALQWYTGQNDPSKTSAWNRQQGSAPSAKEYVTQITQRMLNGGQVNPQNALRQAANTRRSLSYRSIDTQNQPYPIPMTQDELKANMDYYNSQQPPQDQPQEQDQSQYQSSQQEGLSSPARDLMLNTQLSPLPSNELQQASQAQSAPSMDLSKYALPLSRREQAGRDAVNIAPPSGLASTVQRMQQDAQPRRGQNFTSESDHEGEMTPAEAGYANEYATADQKLKNGMTQDRYIDLRKRMDAQQALAKQGVIGKVLSTLVSPYSLPGTDVEAKLVVAATNAFLGNAIQSLNPEAYKKFNESIDLGAVGNFAAETVGGLAGLAAGLTGVGELTKLAAAPMISRLGAGAKLTVNTLAESRLGAAIKTGLEAGMQQAPGQAVSVAKGDKSFMQALKESAMTSAQFGLIAPISEASKVISASTGVSAVAANIAGQVGNMAGGELLSTGQVSPQAVVFGLAGGLFGGHGEAELPRSASEAEALRPEAPAPQTNVEPQQAQPTVNDVGNETQVSPAATSQLALPAPNAQDVNFRESGGKKFDVVHPSEIGSGENTINVAKIPVDVAFPKGAKVKTETETGIPITTVKTEDTGVIHRVGEDGSHEQILAVVDGEKEANPHIVSVFDENGEFKENIVVLKAKDANDARDMAIKNTVPLSEQGDVNEDSYKAAPISKTDLRKWLKSDDASRPYTYEHEGNQVSGVASENAGNVAGGDTGGGGSEEPVPAEDNQAVRSETEESKSAEPVSDIPEIPKSEAPSVEPEPEVKESSEIKTETATPIGVTGIQHLEINENRSENNLPPIEKRPQGSHEAAFAEADTREAKNPNIGGELVSELSDESRNTRQVENWEKVSIDRERIRRDKAYTDAVNQSLEATTDEEKSAADTRVEATLKAKNDADAAQFHAGSASGSGLEFQKVFVNNEDYSLAHIVAQKTQAQNHGKPMSERAPLSPEDQATAQDQAKQIADLQAQLAEHQNKVTDAEGASSFAQLLKTLSNDGEKKATRTGGKLVSFAEAREAKARATLATLDKESGGQLRAQFLPDPRRLAAYADIGFAHIARGVTDFAAWSKKMIEDVGEHIKPHLQAIFEKSKENLAKAAYGAAGKFEDTEEGVLAAAKGESKLSKKTIGALVKAKAQSGITDFDEMMQSVHSDLSSIHLDLTERKVRDTWTDYGAVVHPSKNPILKQMSEWRRIGQLTSAIEDETNGIRSSKSGRTRNEPTPKIKEMTKELYRLLQNNNVETRSPEDLLATNLKRFKTTAKNRIEELQKKIDTGDYSKTPRIKTQLDKEGTELQAKLQKLKDKVNMGIEMDRLSNRPSYEKFLDFVAKWRRFSVLTYPATFGKLLVAAWHNAAMVPIDEAQSGLLHVILPGLESRSSAEQFAPGSIAAFGHGVSEGLKGAGQKLFNRRTDLESLSERERLPNSPLDYPSSLHGMVKEPVKEGAYRRAEYKINKFVNESETPQAQKMRESLTLENDVKQKAYKEAKRSILMQDNFVSDMWRMIGKFADNNKKYPTTGKIVNTAMNVMLPVVKIPSNLAIVTGEYLGGLPVGLARYSRYKFFKGLDNLAPEVADDIMRNIKRGMIGSAAAMLAYNNPDMVGGFYTPRQRDQNDIKPLGFKFFGTDLPPWFAHTPLAIAAQFGATMRRVSDGYVANGAYDPKKAQGLAWATFNSTVGVTENIPMVDLVSRVGTALHDPNAMAKYFGGVAEGILSPGIVQTAAQLTDKTKQLNPNAWEQVTGDKVTRKIGRFPVGVVDQVKLGFPVLRETVPTDDERSDAKSAARKKSHFYALPR